MNAITNPVTLYAAGGQPVEPWVAIPLVIVPLAIVAIAAIVGGWRD